MTIDDQMMSLVSRIIIVNAIYTRRVNNTQVVVVHGLVFHVVSAVKL